MTLLTFRESIGRADEQNMFVGRGTLRVEYTIARMSILSRSLTRIAGAIPLRDGRARAGAGEASAETRSTAERAALLGSYQTVTAARLKSPEPGNWLAIRRTYDGWGFRPLNQITAANVGKLRRVWNIPTGEGASTRQRPSSTTA
jgi:hypothetical protein